MIDIKAAAKNPAYALGAMLYGLQNPISTEDVAYQVDMETYGSVSNDGSVCYGCAATSALEVLTGRSLVEHATNNVIPLHTDTLCETGTIRMCNTVKVFNTQGFENGYFEHAIDCARQGKFSYLMRFFGLGHEHRDQYEEDSTDLFLSTGFWREKIPAFEKIINEMHRDNPDWERFGQ